MAVLVPLTGPAPSAEVFAEVLTALGQPVTAGPGDAATVLDLARHLVAVAERHAIAAQLGADPVVAAGGDGEPALYSDPDSGHDVATTRGFFERLVLAHWRADRLTNTVLTLRTAAPGGVTATGDAADGDPAGEEPAGEEPAGEEPGEDEDEPSVVAGLWEMAEQATLATDAIIAVLATLGTVLRDGITSVTVERLDDATALLVAAGRAAGRLREEIGLGDPHSDRPPLPGSQG